MESKGGGGTSLTGGEAFHLICSSPGVTNYPNIEEECKSSYMRGKELTGVIQQLYQDIFSIHRNPFWRIVSDIFWGRLNISG